MKLENLERVKYIQNQFERLGGYLSIKESKYGVAVHDGFSNFNNFAADLARKDPKKFNKLIILLQLFREEFETEIPEL